jgi:hypothetical protein
LNGLLSRSVTGHEVEQLPCCSQLVVPKLMDEGLDGGPRNERPDYIGVHDVGELIALLGEAADVLA